MATLHLHLLPLIVLVALCFHTVLSQEPKTCFPLSELNWKSAPGRILLNDNQFHFKGVNWFGLENTEVMGGLNKRTLDKIFDFLEAHRFNALRIPFSLKFALSNPNTTYPDRDLINPELYGLTSWEIVDVIFEKAAARGIQIMLDMHKLDPTKGVPQLWYDEFYTEKMALEGWKNMVARYSKHWNLFGIDIKNECHDQCSWGTGNEATDFNTFVEKTILYLQKEVPAYKNLYLVEGIHIHAEGRTPSPWKYWWGGNLFGADKYPIDTGIPELNDRIVYSPHIYGPDVYEMPYFQSPTFPNNLHQIWDNQFGWIIETTGKGIIVGEWGGSCIGKDETTQQYMAEWFVKNCFNDNFWWALNPGSADTEGLLNEDWTRYSKFKMSLLDTVQPDPSSIEFNKSQKSICVNYGTLPNPACYNPLARQGTTALARSSLREGGRWSRSN